MKSFLVYSQKQKNTNRSINGRWTRTEKERFMKGLQRYGRDWVSVQKVVKTRTLAQVRSHAQKVFLKMSEKDIDSLIADESQYEAPIIDHVSISTETDKYHKEQESHVPIKIATKNQPNLLDLFMKAIENQQKDDASQYEHTTFIHEDNAENYPLQIETTHENQSKIEDQQYEKLMQHKIEASVSFQMKSQSIYPILINHNNQHHTY